MVEPFQIGDSRGGALQIVPVGIYHVRMTRAQLRDAANRTFGIGAYCYDDLFALDDREFAERVASVKLVELQVEDPNQVFDLDEIWLSRPGVSRSESQVPYDEVLLAAFGETPIELPAPRFRVVFFLHEYDGQGVLQTQVGALALPACSEMPARLRSLCVYLPL